jgi:hypothetical protein
VGKVLSVVLLGPFEFVVSLLEQVAAEAYGARLEERRIASERIVEASCALLEGFVLFAFESEKPLQ